MAKKRFQYVAAGILLCFYFAFANFYQNIAAKVIAALIVTITIVALTKYNNEKYNCLQNENDIFELIHDLKTPAIAQLRVTDYLVNGYFGDLNDSQKEIAVQLNNSARYMSDIINNFLLLCRVKHNNISFEKEDFDINDIVKQCIADLKYIAEDKRCTILFDYSQEQILVFGAKTELKRVVMNILTNAVKYSYPNRVITALSTIKQNSYIFEVNSFGDYIEENQLKNICGEYKTLQKSSTGLGLYICEIILKKHNSKINVKSDKKTGNNFGFALQLADVSVHK